MSIPQVGMGSVPIVPTLRGFRKEVEREVDGSTRSAGSRFTAGFRSAGQSAGQGFSAAFKQSTSTITAAGLKSLTADVAKSARDLSAARLKEQDAAGKVRVAEAQLRDARKRYAADSSQVVRAEERLASVQRNSISTKGNLVSATDKLTAAQKRLKDATGQAAREAEQSGGFFSRMGRTFGQAGTQAGDVFKRNFGTSTKEVFAGAFFADLAASAVKSIAGAGVTALRTGLDYSFQSVNLASELEQNTGAVTAVFKDQADEVFAAGERAAQGVGLSNSAYLQFSTVVGSQLKNLGLPIDQVAGKTDELIALGADLAAQFGGPTSDAVGAISSLLRGERDPIERYGVGLKQVDIDARMAAMGLGELEGEAEKQATIQATLGLLWDQTVDAQGTFLREQDTYAGKQQRVNAELEDAQTRFGEALLPFSTTLMEIAGEDLLPAFASALQEIGPDLAAGLQDTIPVLKDLIKELPELLELLPGMVDGFTNFLMAANDVKEWFDGKNAPDPALRAAVLNGQTADQMLAENPSLANSPIAQAKLAEMRLIEEELGPLAEDAATNTMERWADGIENARNARGRAVSAAKTLAGDVAAALMLPPSGSPVGAGTVINQENNYASEDPQVAATLAQQQLNALARRQ